MLLKKKKKTVEEKREKKKKVIKKKVDFSVIMEMNGNKLLVIQMSLHVDLKKEEPWQQDTLFHMRCTSHGKVCHVIVDSGSCTTAVSEDMVTKLGLKSKAHPKPYNIRSLQDGKCMKITKCCIVPFSIGKIYHDEISCDVMRMDACHLLLGRP